MKLQNQGRSKMLYNLLHFNKKFKKIIIKKISLMAYHSIIIRQCVKIIQSSNAKLTSETISTIFFFYTKNSHTPKFVAFEVITLGSFTCAQQHSQIHIAPQKNKIIYNNVQSQQKKKFTKKEMFFILYICNITKCERE